MPEMREMEYFSKPSLYRPGLLNAQVTLAVIKNNGTAMMKSAQGNQPIRFMKSPF
jgi:hypothetical protein